MFTETSSGMLSKIMSDNNLFLINFVSSIPAFHSVNKINKLDRKTFLENLKIKITLL